MMEIEEQIQSEPHVILQEGHVVAEANEHGSNDGM